METHHNKRSTFSGKLGFVLSAAGASVGLGNIWRFPYLAAKYGGGIFLLIYIILALTFGYTMIMAETTLGRMTRKSPVGAYASFGKSKWLSFGGWINAIIPVLIVPYYSVIGGWVIKYLFSYVIGQGSELAADGYFSAFISDGVSTEICFVIFALLTVGIIYAGVRNGVERVSKFMMPILVVLSVIIAVYSVTRPGALEGVKYFLIPNVENFSWMTVVTAMGQMFITIPKVFASMGFGNFVGILFFLLVLCAALTSSIALTESAVSTFQDELGWSRKKAALIVGVIMIALGTLSCLGYGPLAGVQILKMQFLDFFDFLTNSVMMPIAAIATCLLISKVVGTKKIEEEVLLENGTFRRKRIFNFMIRYLCPIFAAIILISSVANAFGWISM